MTLQERKALARRLEEQSESVLETLTGALESLGFEGVQIVGFSVGPDADQPRTFSVDLAAAPCRTVCRVSPDGSIRCEVSC